LVFFALASFAQEATAVQTVNLRADPSTANPPVKLLHSGTMLILLDPIPHGGFYHIKTEDGQEGWVWSKNITVSGIPSPALSTIAQCDDSLWDHLQPAAAYREAEMHRGHRNVGGREQRKEC